ncbi:RNA polymerase subunit sigma [Ectopseudomonas toyotomiensis]|uniref:RNA polymerase, sigma subunit, ECF family n=1 Tax=Ectopseudomonas toyotomiensis TaxID=554344 RepID=A0A1I5RH00_9GAMM|nr:RNA polymerase sigma factor [Pseudomonas toyotomiensis]PIA74505.1 RNA polymerase subunit sigma [Pseudomonas toyotomiensis]SFP57607.1 RNA polymerase, sigma subunit, ECF family [Pseudomonas toyotomiensis]
MNAPLTDDDAALLRRYRRGDAAAFNALYQRHRLGLFRFLLGLCGDHALAEEVFQETWMSLVRSQSEQRESVLFKTWLYQIARNRLIDHWRKSGRHQVGHDAYDEGQHAQPDPQPGPEQQWGLSRDSERLQAALADLPEDQREVFLLRAHGDLELNEIAELTRTPAETVKSRLRYALQKLRRLLATEELSA